MTKYVDELYADVFAKTYGIEYIGLRYFNVFGRRQDPNSMYAAVIPLFIKQFLNHKQPNMNLLILLSRAATNIFRNPPIFTSLVVIGSLILLGMLPSAAS